MLRTVTIFEPEEESPKNTISALDSLPPIRAALDIYSTPPDEGETLIGDRFLCRGGGMLLVGPSGVGKSTFTAGMCAAFAKGEPYVGITPATKLKILVIQAENDDGDLHEQLKGAFGDSLDKDDEVALEKYLSFATVDHLSGRDFLNEAVSSYLAEYKPDIVVIDCLSAYLGDSPTEDKALIAFLRNGLTTLLREHKCGCIMVHHTPKTTNQNRSAWTASDRQYGMAGGAGIANWMRAGLEIEATTEPGIFFLTATKRGSRLGWTNSEGKKTLFRLIRHSRPEEGSPENAPLRWERVDKSDIERLEIAQATRKGGPKRRECSPEMLLSVLPPEGRGAESCLNSSRLSFLLKEKKLCTKDDFSGFIQGFVESGVISSAKVKRETLYGRPDDVAAMLEEPKGEPSSVPNKNDDVAADFAAADAAE
jgi:KaiC/GvpD/RAD55 family RecA-like ATPase